MAAILDVSIYARKILADRLILVSKSLFNQIFGGLLQFPTVLFKHPLVELEWQSRRKTEEEDEISH